MGAIGCFSFYPGKNLGACGEGGALVTNDAVVATKARMLRDHGQSQKHIHSAIGYNYRMDDFQGAVLAVKLRYLNAWTEQRRSVAAQYDKLLANCGAVCPRHFPDGGHVYHLYVIRDDDRDGLREHLKKQGVASGMHYPIPIHLQEPFHRFGCKEGDLPITEALARTCLSLPIYPEMSPGQVEYAAQVICSAGGSD